MRRRFVVVVREVKDLIDCAPLLARCVSAAVMLSHGLRSDSDLVLATPNGFSAHFITSKLRNVRPDEASLTGILRKAVRAYKEGRTRSAHWGVVVSTTPLDQYLAPVPRKFLCASVGIGMEEALKARENTAFIVPALPGVTVEVDVPSLRCPIDRWWPDQVISHINVCLDRQWPRWT